MPMPMQSFLKELISDYWKYVPRDPEDRSDEENIEGKIAIVTGCNTGLGKSTVVELAKRGAKVIMACRDLTKTRIAYLEVQSKVPEADLVIMELDLGDLNSVRRFVENVKEKFTHINILINNAGVSNPTGKLQKTKDGFELHMGVNHLSHFLLTMLLLDHLKKGAPSRIVAVSSAVHCFAADLNLNNLMLENITSFGPKNLLPYGNSKLANILFMRELSKRLEGTGVTTYALCPGAVKTDILRIEQPWYERLGNSIIFALIGFTPEQGCQTQVLCAVSKSLGQESGQMYRLEKRWDRVSDELDEDLGLKLFEISLNLVGLGDKKDIIEDDKK